MTLNQQILGGFSGGSLGMHRGSQIIDVFIDSANGDDRNSGLDGAPIQTIPAAYEKFPQFPFGGGNSVIRLNFAAGPSNTQAIYETPLLIAFHGQPISGSYLYRGPSMVPFTPATGTSTGTVSAVNLISANRTRLDFNPNPGWTNNNLATRFARVTRGASQVIFECPITANTANQLFIDTGGLVGVILVNDIVTIVQPGARIRGLTADFNFMSLVGFGSTEEFNSTHGGLTFERLSLFGLNCHVSATFDRCDFQFFPSFRQPGQYGWVNCACNGQLVFVGNSVSDPLFCRNNVNPINTTAGLSALVVSGGELFVGRPNMGGCLIPSRGISVYRAAVGGSTGALHVGPTGRVVFAVAPLISLQGDGNAAMGMHARGGLIRIPSPNANPGLITITGATDMAVDGTTLQYGVGAGQFEEAGGFNGNVHRIGGSTAAIPLGQLGLITTRSLD